jgi:hypothetical protein
MTIKSLMEDDHKIGYVGVGILTAYNRWYLEHGRSRQRPRTLVSPNAFDGLRMAEGGSAFSAPGAE